MLNIRVFESVNTTNPNKGGVAIISLDPNIDMKLEDADYYHNTNWITEMPQAKRDAVDKEAALGRWILTSFLWNNKTIHVATI